MFVRIIITAELAYHNETFRTLHSPGGSTQQWSARQGSVWIVEGGVGGSTPQLSVKPPAKCPRKTPGVTFNLRLRFTGVECCENRLIFHQEWMHATVNPLEWWSWLANTGCWWVGCYVWYSEEGTGRSRSPPSPLLAVSNVTAHPSTARVPITVLLYNGPLLCGFNVPVKG